MFVPPGRGIFYLGKTLHCCSADYFFECGEKLLKFNQQCDGRSNCEHDADETNCGKNRPITQFAKTAGSYNLMNRVLVWSTMKLSTIAGFTLE